ncbi:hypothetical protein [Tsukamurella pseudospumae]|uniref:Uncharacterized protein n=1 Tax=Tsukamurella pseudospumae TaxID=239498 RepID=A0A137ZSX2_9ACTN|nr:hypothetical protein [Tsukamurella pseudospumae]KXP01292.1 hypothetical protein AXK61_00260 [Tsukamurella pseudospumae]
MIDHHVYLWTDGEAVLYVGRDGGFYDFRVFLGRLGEPLREIEARPATRYRDGGTTSIPTVEGELLAPRPATFSWMGSSDFPALPCVFTWSDGRPPVELPRVDPDDYVIWIGAEQRDVTVLVSH